MAQARSPVVAPPARQASVERVTRETKIRGAVNLDGTGTYDVATGIGFLDHMLEQLSRHSLIDLSVRAEGDLHIDFHHTTEDTGYVVGEAVSKALGDRRGIARWGDALVPMDETLTRVALDASNRPYLVWKVKFTKPKLGEMDTELFKEWFQAFVQSAGVTLHVDGHHTVEDTGIALGQALARALGDRAGIRRYGAAHIPMDETLTEVALDASNRPYLIWKVVFSKPKLGTMDTELFKEWFQAFAQLGGLTLHVWNHYGDNNHHIVESCYKGLARSLRQAVAIDPRRADAVPSTKGTLGGSV